MQRQGLSCKQEIRLLLWNLFYELESLAADEKSDKHKKSNKYPDLSKVLLLPLLIHLAVGWVSGSLLASASTKSLVYKTEVLASCYLNAQRKFCVLCNTD